MIKEEQRWATEAATVTGDYLLQQMDHDYGPAYEDLEDVADLREAIAQWMADVSGSLDDFREAVERYYY